MASESWELAVPFVLLGSAALFLVISWFYQKFNRESLITIVSKHLGIFMALFLVLLSISSVQNIVSFENSISPNGNITNVVTLLDTSTMSIMSIVLLFAFTLLIGIVVMIIKSLKNARHKKEQGLNNEE